MCCILYLLTSMGLKSGVPLYQMSDDVMVVDVSKVAEGLGGLGAWGTAASMRMARMGKTGDLRQLDWLYSWNGIVPCLLALMMGGEFSWRRQVLSYHTDGRNQSRGTTWK